MQAVMRAGYDRPTAAAVLDKPHRASLHRHAADILVRRTVGDAVDGAGGTYYHGDRRTLSRAHVFTRFITPAKPEDMPGMWRRYYQRWRETTRERIDPAFLE